MGDVPNRRYALPSTQQIINTVIDMGNHEITVRESHPLPLVNDKSVVQDAAGGQFLPLLNAATKVSDCQIFETISNLIR